MIGVVFVGVSMALIFHDCLFCEWFDNWDNGMYYFFYCLFPATYNFGWAFCQVNHMSLGPSLTCSRSRRDKLSNLRNTFTYVANLTVLILAFIYFAVIDDAMTQFLVLGYSVVAIGVAAGLFFLFSIEENKLVAECKTKSKYLQNLEEQKKGTTDAPEIEEMDEAALAEKRRKANFKEYKFDEKKSSIVRAKTRVSIIERSPHWADWFKEPMFYQYGFVYMGARICMNIASVGSNTASFHPLFS